MSADAQLVAAVVALLIAGTAVFRDLYAKLARCESRHDECDERVAKLEKKRPRARGKKP